MKEEEENVTIYECDANDLELYDECDEDNGGSSNVASAPAAGSNNKEDGWSSASLMDMIPTRYKTLGGYIYISGTALSPRAKVYVAVGRQLGLINLRHCGCDGGGRGGEDGKYNAFVCDVEEDDDFIKEEEKQKAECH